MPTLSQLEYIIAVDHFRHFGKASAHCHVSQPSLSMQVHKAEEDLGIVIFDRQKKPIKPTENGAKVIEQARHILSEHKKLLQLSSEASTEPGGKFHLGIIPTLSPYVLPLFIETFSQKYPKVDLYVEEAKTEDIASRLRRDELDGGILATPLDEKGIKEKPLFYEPFYVYSSPKHPLHQLESLKVSRLTEQHEVWLMQDGHCFRNQLINMCSTASDSAVFKNIHFESGNLETLRYLIKKTKGYTLLPHLFMQTLPKGEKEKMVRSFDGKTPAREVSLVYSRTQWKMDILEALEKTIWECLPKDLPKEAKSNFSIVDIDSSKTEKL